MALPKLTVNEYTLTVPSTQEEIKFRPFLVKEQKILMIAEESSDEKQIASSMAKLVSDCTFESVDAMTSPMFDIEYIFLQIRAKSVGEQVELEVTCPDDNETRVKVEINLNEINIQMSLEHSKSIKLTERGRLYKDIPRLSFVPGSGGGSRAVGECISLDIKGAVEEIELTSPGEEYTSAPEIKISNP